MKKRHISHGEALLFNGNKTLQYTKNEEGCQFLGTRFSCYHRGLLYNTSSFCT